VPPISPKATYFSVSFQPPAPPAQQEKSVSLGILPEQQQSKKTVSLGILPEQQQSDNQRCRTYCRNSNPTKKGRFNRIPF